MRLLGFPLWVAANIKMFFRDRTTLFWAIVFPILFMGLLGVAFGRADPVSFDVGVIDEDDTEWSRALGTALKDDRLPFTLQNFTSRDAAIAAVESGAIDVALVVPSGFGGFMENQTFPGGDQNATLQLPVYWGLNERGTGQVAVGAIQEATDAFFLGATGETPRLGVDPQAVNAETFEYIDFLAPGILAMSIMQNGVFGLSLFIVSAREKRILKRLQATPAGASYILAGRIVPAVLISFVQSGILLSLAVFGFGVEIAGNFLLLLVAIAFGSFVFITLGFFISSVSKTVDSAESLTNVITLPMFFLGGVFIPIDTLPQAIQFVAYAMPLTYFSDALRDIMIQNGGLADIALEIGVLALFALVVFALAVKLFRWE